MRKGNRIKNSVRAHRAPLYVALSVFVAMAVALVVLLAGRSKAFASDIPANYGELPLADLTATGSGITHLHDSTYQIDDATGFVTLARVSQKNSLEEYTFQIAAREVITLTAYDADGTTLTETGFYGIGSETVPFRGKIVYESGVTDHTAIEMKGWKVLFNNLSTKASITSADGVNGKKLVAYANGAFSLCDTLTVENTEANENNGTVLDISGFRFAARTGVGENVTGVVTTEGPGGLVAAKVTGTGICAVDLTNSMDDAGAYEINAGGTVGGLFGIVESGVTLTATLPGNLNLTATTTAGHAGALVGENKGSFTVNGLTSLTAVATAADNSAAGLVGVNSGSVTFAGNITVPSVTVGGKYAGGVVGKSERNADVVFNGDAALTQVTATGNTIGGVMGASEGKITVADEKTCTVSNATLTATGDTPCMGGFAGQFTAQSETTLQNVAVSAVFTGTGTDTAHTVGGYFGLLTANGSVRLSTAASSNFTFNSVKSGHMGGLVGKAAGNSAVTLSGATAAAPLTVSSTFNNTGYSGTLGGAVGTVESGVYLKTENLSVTNTMSTMTDGMADLVGVAADGAMVDVSRLTYKNANKASVLISQTGEGTVLRLSGNVKDNSANSGHIVRRQSNSLLYAENGVSYNTAATPAANDVGNYGQILRNGNIGNIISFKEDDHSVTLNGEKLNQNSLTLSNTADAAKLAITLQTHGAFSGVEGIGKSNYATLLTGNKTINFGADIDLHNTGVEQFTCAAESAAFTGTINGNTHTLTLAMGETIRNADNNGNNKNVGILKDDVNARTYLGAFSALSGATVSNLTVGGTITYADYIDDGGTVCIGGLAGYAAGNAAISGCTTNVAITLNASGNRVTRNNVYAGGFIGQAKTGNGSLSVTGSTVAAAITHSGGYLSSTDDGKTVCLGGAIGTAETTSQNAISFTNNTIRATINQEVQVVNAHVGGFIADLVCRKYVDVDMTGTKAENASVTSNASPKASYTAGGLIGYSFQQCRLVLNGAWAGTVNAKSSVGGLLYKLEGKLTVNDDFSVNGSAFISGAGDRGALLGDGTNAFVIIKSVPEKFVGIPKDFDLFVGKNITTYASNGVAAEGGLVTVETGTTDIGKLPGSTSGWYDLMNTHSNSKTRYYFNIVGLEKYSATTAVSSGKDLIYWNVYDFIQNVLPNYVRAESFPKAVNDIESASKDINMSDYCFYPTQKERVTFNFSGKKLTFGVENPPAAAQFCGLQSGIFSDITTGDTTITVTFENIVLAGTAQPVSDDSSGAFVCGKIMGKSDTRGTATAQVNVSNVFLSGLKVEGTGYRPLLINTIDSNSNCTISDMSQYTRETYKTVGKTNTYKNGEIAASSLIGCGGVTSGGKMSEYVSVTFKDIGFASETNQSIFTTATLFDSIACTNNTSSFTYNFKLADDWADANNHIRAVTYGTELSTNPKQYEYHDQKLFVNPTEYPTQGGSENGNFSTGYKPYVRATSTDSAVLRVNWKVVEFNDGWGTYEHPYEISTPAQLTFLSNLVANTVQTFDNGWSIQYPKKDNYSESETYIADSNGKLKKAGGAELSVSELLTYLRGAYYKITASTLVAEDGFVGIGNDKNPFHGVIVGYDPAKKTVIQMPNKTGIGKDGYGFINAANGCAVYGLEIRYGAVGLSNSYYNSATSRPFAGNASTEVSHFGGVIAWVIGGDNVIDHVSVTVQTLNQGHKTSVFGGYVGFVTGGGVTVRDLGAAVSKDQTDASSDFYYYNPYVGKVLCGYVLADKAGQRYDNTAKNYDIPIITKSAAQTPYYNKTFTLDDADDVYMLGFAINGGALKCIDKRDKGLAGNDAIAYGKNSDSLSRHGNYSVVGVDGQNAAALIDGRYEDDSRGEGESLFSDYFGKSITGINQDTNSLTLKLTGVEYNLSEYPNAFRGFGSPYAGTECYSIGKVTGTKDSNGNPATTVILAMDLKQYFYNGNTLGNIYEPDSVKNLALVTESAKNGIAFSNITISGKVALAVYNLNNNGNLLDYKARVGDATPPPRKQVLFCQAGFAGYAENAKFENVAIEDLAVESPGWAAGLVASENDRHATSSAENCRIDGLKTKALQSTGAVYAYLRAGTATAIKYVTVANSEIQLLGSGLDDVLGDTYNASVGGLVGYAERENKNYNDHKLTVDQAAVSASSVLTLNKRSGNNITPENANAGGFVGCLKDVELSLSNCWLDGSVVAAVLAKDTEKFYASDYNSSSAVPLKGAVYDKVQNMAAYMLDKYVRDQAITAENGNAGGFVGYSGAKITIQNSQLTSNAQHSTVILSSKNAGGIVGTTSQNNAAHSFTDLKILAGAQPVYILGAECAAGINPWNNQGTNTITASRINISGNDSQPVYILGAGSTAPAAGLFGDMPNANSITVTDAVVSNCVLSGARAVGVLGTKSNGKTVQLSNLKIFDNILQGNGESVAGVINTAHAGVVVDGAYLGGNVIRMAGKNANAGVLADTVNSGATLTGYDILLKGNDADYANAKSVREILAANDRSGMYNAGVNADKVGLVAYQNSGTVNILAISSEDERYPQFGNGSGNGNCVLFAGYGAPTVFETKYKTNPAYTPKQALAEHGISIAGLDGRFNGDPVTSQNRELTPDFLNEKTVDSNSKLWNNNALHLDSTGMKKLSELVSGEITSNTDLPVLHITGKTDDTLADYLDLLTNGGYRNMGSAFKIQSAVSNRYQLDETGALSKVEDAGSIGYDSTTGKFIAGKYDNLESEGSKTLSILTVTIADAAGKHSYTMHAVVYYPQVLEYTSAIYALEGEVYQLSSFTPQNSKIDIMAGSKFSLYMEYAYNDVATKIEDYNLDKQISCWAMSGDTRVPNFKKDTKLVLIDLNSQNAADFQSYYYTLEADTDTIHLSQLKSSNFKRGEKTFDEITLQQVVSNHLAGKIADQGKYHYVERYLMVVIPPNEDKAQKQFNLRAEVPAKNEKNITVIGEKQGSSISVWNPPGGTLEFNNAKTSQTFSNTPEKLLQSELKVRQEFAKGYILAMKGRALYGTHILKITQADTNSGVLLPAGTVVTLTAPDGTLLMSTRLAQAGTSVRYSVEDIIPHVSADGVYLDDIMVSVDFSGASPLEFNRSFLDGEMYQLQDTFYLSGDREHYVGGTEANCATGTIKAEKASPVKLALVPTDRKHLAINFGNLSETTDDGKIDFNLATDISAVVEEGVEVNSVKVGFSVWKKVLAEGTYIYRELDNSDLAVVKSLTGVDENYSAVLTRMADEAGTPKNESWTTKDTFSLAVDTDEIRKTLTGDNEQSQDYDVLTNYRLVAKVTVEGTDKEGQPARYEATGYFTFLLCNIHANVF